MTVYVITTRTVTVRSYRVISDSPSSAVESVLDGDEDPIDIDSESEAVIEIFDDSDGDLKEVALPENAR